MMFGVGEKVVCVNNSPMPGYFNSQECLRLLRVNAVYTVAAVNSNGGIALFEIGEIFYGRKRFKRYVEKKTDISVFQNILRKINENNPVTEDV